MDFLLISFSEMTGFGFANGKGGIMGRSWLYTVYNSVRGGEISNLLALIAKKIRSHFFKIFFLPLLLFVSCFILYFLSFSFGALFSFFPPFFFSFHICTTVQSTNITTCMLKTLIKKFPFNKNRENDGESTTWVCRKNKLYEPPSFGIKTGCGREAALVTLVDDSWGMNRTSVALLVLQVLLVMLWTMINFLATWEVACWSHHLEMVLLLTRVESSNH